MDPQHLRRLILLIITPLLLSLLLWEAFHETDFGPASLVPPVVVILAMGAAMMRSGKPRATPSPRARIAAGVVAALIAAGAVVWDHHAARSPEAHASALPQWLVLAVVVLLAAGMLFWRLSQRKQEQAPR